MKYYMIACLFVVGCMAVAPLEARGGGGSVAGGIMGGMAGGMIAGSIAHSSSSSRAESEAIRAQDKVDQMRAEQERERVEQLRRDVEERKGQESRDTRFYLMLVMIFAILFGVGILALLFMRK
jgi:succinate dehydrogenase/fumarate reductase flavoprotein subunit